MTQDGTYMRNNLIERTGYGSTNPLVFDSANTTLGGLEILGKMLTTGALTSTLTELAPPGFIIHEVLIYPKQLTDAEDVNVRQWIEDKYGIDV